MKEYENKLRKENNMTIKEQKEQGKVLMNNSGGTTIYYKKRSSHEVDDKIETIK